MNALESELHQACTDGDLDIIKSLVAKGVDIKMDDDVCIVVAAREGHKNIVEYLLTSPDIAVHANPYARKGVAFVWACINNRKQVLEYLVCDYKIDLNYGYIKDYLYMTKKDFKDIISARQQLYNLDNILSYPQPTKLSKI